jgi:hypothetical protein
MEASMPTVRILSVDSVSIQIGPSDPPNAVITAQGLATTGGWTNVRLNPLEKKLSADGIFDLELVGDTPDGIVPQMLTPVQGSFLMKEDVARLVGVRIEARSNHLTHLIPTQTAAAAAPKTAFLAEEGMTTMALGEEFGGPQPTTILGGEEGGGPSGGPKTAAVAEEGKTFLIAEEGKTFALGEENPQPKTAFVGEESPKTLAFGEEGPGPKTAAIAEEGKTFVFSEEGKTAFVGEETPKTLAFGEEGPGPKTAALIEEGKTFVFSEEGGTTAPRFEEGKPILGETNPALDDPKPPFGEGNKAPVGEEFDPGFRTPFGRR